MTWGWLAICMWPTPPIKRWCAPGSAAVLAGKTQGERLRAIQSAVLYLQRLAHPKRAAGGFAGVLVNVFERGLEVCK